MQFTEAQRLALKAYIQSDPTLGPKATSGDYQGVADGLNAIASPAFVFWRKPVSVNDVWAAMNWGRRQRTHAESGC